jgi:hypothetical protein
MISTFHRIGLSLLGILTIFLFSLPTAAGAEPSGPWIASQNDGGTFQSVQYYPRRYPPGHYPPGYYPPGYYPPTSDPYHDTKGSPGSGWIVIEVDPPEAAVYVDGHKLEPQADNTYEEGVLAGRHKVEAKKGGYRDYVRFVDVPPGVKETVTIQMKKIP